MIVEHRGAHPRIDPSATVAPGAIISGKVIIGAHTAVLAGAIITSQGAPVHIGARCAIMENAVVRGAGVHPCFIADHVLIGPHAYVSGASLGRGCFIATGASVFNGAVIEEGVTVAVQAVVHIATRCPTSTLVPIGHTAFGDPADIYPPEQILTAHHRISSLGFTKTVFGFDSSKMTDLAATVELCERYTRALARHNGDRVISA